VDTYAFLIPLVLGFWLAGASAFTAAYSRRFGERGGQLVTSILRNFLGIPLWLLGLIMAWNVPAPRLLGGGTTTDVVAGVLIAAGLIPVVWGHLLLGWRTHMPSMRDTLVRHGLYAYVRHPIYAGSLPFFVGLALLKPTTTVVVACAAAVVWFVVQARLEEIDLLQRLPAYRRYMQEVPGFVPRWRKRS
jgi:protein-S-isoprenylcysteine O-methyltransferase Ste14